MESMESRVALIGVIVENRDSVDKLNSLLHQHAEYIIGRMGIPYPKRGISIISISMDAPADVISSLSGKLGMLPGVNIKTVYSKTSEKQ
jgi:putative iron-only hydrogenase system regulator